MSGTNILRVVLGAWAILAVLSLFGLNDIPLPAGWLEAWTKWIATVVAIVVSARVLWSGAELLHKLSKNSSSDNRPSGSRSRVGINASGDLV